MILVVARLRSPCVYSITWIAISYKMKLWWFFCQKKALHLSDGSVETLQFPGRKQWNTQTLAGDGLWARTKHTHTHTRQPGEVCVWARQQLGVSLQQSTFIRPNKQKHLVCDVTLQCTNQTTHRSRRQRRRYRRHRRHHCLGLRSTSEILLLSLSARSSQGSWRFVCPADWSKLKNLSRQEVLGRWQVCGTLRVIGLGLV